MPYPFFDEGARLKALKDQIDRPTFILTGVGALLVRTSQKAFREQRLGQARWKDRGETKMVPNWPAVILDFARGKSAPPERRFEPRPVLTDNGMLRRSFSWRIVARDTVEEGTVLPYGDALHAGKPTLTEVISKTVQQRLWAWMKKLGARAQAAAGRLAGADERDRVKRMRADPKVQRAAWKLAGLQQWKARKGKGSGANNKARRAAIAKAKADLQAAKQAAYARIQGHDAGAHGRSQKATALHARTQQLGWLLNKGLTGRRLTVHHPARPMVGVPAELVQEVEKLYGISVRRTG